MVFYVVYYYIVCLFVNIDFIIKELVIFFFIKNIIGNIVDFKIVYNFMGYFL